MIEVYLNRKWSRLISHVRRHVPIDRSFVRYLIEGSSKMARLWYPIQLIKLELNNYLWRLDHMKESHLGLNFSNQKYPDSEKTRMLISLLETELKGFQEQKDLESLKLPKELPINKSESIVQEMRPEYDSLKERNPWHGDVNQSSDSQHLNPKSSK